MFVMVLSASLWALTMMGLCSWVWSAAFMALGVFVDRGSAVYLALETFTTLGFGDILPPHQRRILAGMAAANGLLNFGLMTAVLMEGVLDLRLRQTRRHGRRARSETDPAVPNPAVPDAGGVERH